VFVGALSFCRYGGEGFGEMRPEDVVPGDWYTLKDLVKNQVGAFALRWEERERCVCVAECCQRGGKQCADTLNTLSSHTLSRSSSNLDPTCLV